MSFVHAALLTLLLLGLGHQTVRAQSNLAPVPGTLAPPRAAPPAAPSPPQRATAAPARPAATPARPTTRSTVTPPPPRAPIFQAPRVQGQAAQAQPANRAQPPRPRAPRAAAAPPTLGRATPPPNRRPAAAAAATAAGVATVAGATAAARTAPSTQAAIPAPRSNEPPPGPVTGPVTGLPMPRFAALRSDEVNMRVGPSTSYPIEWTFQRRDLPVQIIGEFQLWRRIRDPEGAEGWVHSSTLAGRRTVLVRSPAPGTETTLRREAQDSAGAVARLRPGVIARIRECEADIPWCEVQVAGYRGYLRRAEIWGVDAAEEVK